MRTEEVELTAHSPMVGKSLRDPGIGSQIGAIILGILGPDWQSRADEAENKALASVVFREGDILIALGDDEQLGSLQAFAEGQVQT